MHRPDKALVEYARQCGFELQPGFNGRDHYTFIHPDGHQVNAAQSPSDHRAYKNARAQMSRLTGIHPSRKKAAKYKRRGKQSGFSMDAAKRDRNRADAGRRSEWNTKTTRPIPEHIAKRRDHLEQQFKEARAAATTGYPYQINEALRLKRELDVFTATHVTPLENS